MFGVLEDFEKRGSQLFKYAYLKYKSYGKKSSKTYF